MKSHRIFLNALAAGVMLFAASTAHAQLTDSQTYTVTIPSNLTINAINPAAALTHDETNNNQTFGAEQWDVTANVLNGANVTLETNQAFTHTVDGSYQADANLLLAIASADAAAGWTVTNPSDQTNYGIGDGVATVQAESSRAGNVSFNLTVTFITGTFSELAQGDYVTTVTGTLAAN